MGDTDETSHSPDRYLSGPEYMLDWPDPVRGGIGQGEVNGRNQPADAVESVRWLGWWIDPVDLVAWHPDDWSYGLHLRDLVDARRALFTIAHVAARYHHPGPLAGDQTARWRLAVGLTVLLDEVLQIRDIITQPPYRVPTAADVRTRLETITQRIASNDDDID